MAAYLWLGVSTGFGDWIEDLFATAQALEKSPSKARNAWDNFERQHPLQCDWLQQDFKPQAWQLLTDLKPSNLEAMIQKVSDQLRQKGIAPSSAKTTGSSEQIRDLFEQYAGLCMQRRELRLNTIAQKFPRWIYTKHYNMGGSHYAYTEGQSDAQAERHFYPGSALCLLNYSNGSFATETLLDDPSGVIRDPDVSYDGKRILFSWKKSDREDDYHLYEMEYESRKIRQLTFGLGVADYEGVYLPNGNILFNSTRCVQIVDCWWTEVSNLYRCDSNGKNIRRVTFDQVHDNYPTVTDDGRILYTRWEYNDRSQIYTQPLLQMMSDGTGQTEYYGVNSWFPTTILHARGIPGTEKAIAIATGHHSRQTGKLILVDPAKGRQENQGVQLIAPMRPTRAEKIDAYGQGGELFQYPYPLNDHEMAVTYHALGWHPERNGNFAPRFGIYYMHFNGERELLAADPKLPCNQPVPLMPRVVPHTRPELVDYSKNEGSYYVQDVYFGASMAGVPRGKVKTLRVVALDFRAAGIGNNGNSGPGGAALISTPTAIGNGAWDPKSILGDATVYEDGSVFFSAPARQALYFQLLDEKGRQIQTMRSWTSLQPGENASCVGCHESKNSSAPTLARPTLALKAGMEKLKPFYGPARGFSYIREIQPILNSKCASCHDGKKTQIYDLTDKAVLDPGAKRYWLRSYLTLTHSLPDDRGQKGGSAWRGNPDHEMVNWISAASVPSALPPYSAGASQSRLIRILDEGHQGVKMGGEEMAKLSAWIDLGVPFCSDYIEANAWNEDEKAKYQHFVEKRKRFESAENN